MTALGIALIKALAGLAVIIAGLAWFRRDAAKDANDKTALAAAERQAKTQEKINHADLGIGSTDAERVRRLKDFAAK